MRSFLTLAIFVASAICTRTALSQQTRRVDVPFSFTVKSQTFPAGYYSVESVFGEAFIGLTNDVDPSKHIKVVTAPADPRHEPVVLTFSLEGSTHVLAEIQYASAIAKF